MWNDIELLANDDTGSEQLPVGLGYECGTALYQVDTLLQITSSEKVEFIKAVVLFLNNYQSFFIIYSKVSQLLYITTFFFLGLR